MRYSKAASVFSGRAAQLFRKLAADEKKHFSRLQSEYFILTGDTYAVKPFPSGTPKGLLPALRESFISETKAAEDYVAAARESDKRLFNLFSMLADDAEMHAESLGKFINNIIK